MFGKRKNNSPEVLDETLLSVSTSYRAGRACGELHAALGKDEDNICLECGRDTEPCVVLLTHRDYISGSVFTTYTTTFHRWRN